MVFSLKLGYVGESIRLLWYGVFCGETHRRRRRR